MKSIITANFNLLKQNSIWDKLNAKDQFIFDEYNNLNFTLNNDLILKKYDKYYLVIYVNEMTKVEKNIKNFFSILNRVANKNLSKKFYVFFLKEKIKNEYLDQYNLLKLNKYFSKLENKKIDTSGISIKATQASIDLVLEGVLNEMNQVQKDVTVSIREVEALIRESEKDVRNNLRETEDRLDRSMKKLEDNINQRLQELLDNPLSN